MTTTALALAGKLVDQFVNLNDRADVAAAGESVEDDQLGLTYRLNL
ncbi:hypothetical protein [Bradyrhizobium genosp. P]